MNKKILWALLALAAVVILILAITLPRQDSKAPEDPKEAAAEQEAESALSEAETEPETEPLDQMGTPTEDGELPRDTSTMKPVSDSDAGQIQPTAEPEDTAPNTDPETGIELEDDELPIDPT